MYTDAPARPRAPARTRAPVYTHAHTRVYARAPAHRRTRIRAPTHTPARPQVHLKSRAGIERTQKALLVSSRPKKACWYQANLKRRAGIKLFFINHGFL